MRLNRYLALCGLGSRRACEEIILNGSVRINGRPVRELATVVQPGDTVVARGRVVRPESSRYVVLHKPSGCLTSRA
jgi:23S rRNA pseudouridine2605 synthase